VRTFILWLFAAVVAAVVCARTTRQLVSHAPLRERNYRGLQIPTAGGIAVLIAFSCATAAVGVLHLLFSSSEMLADAAGAGLIFVGAGLGFGFLGLWDDVAGGQHDRGWRAHVDALRKGRTTPGALKILGGAALALVLVVSAGESFWWSLVDAAIVALAANSFNLLDKRPGRASKWFLIAAIAIMIVGGFVAASLAAAIGAVALYVPFDLRERVMLGDSGANGLGAIIGVATVLGSTHGFRLIALVILLAVNVAGARPGLSHVIRSVKPLERFDMAGRVSE
jgi:UDP-N-acetylmuramyl pentapeptide phosphotransferase/UDP-N-acetylglucosamine-1-phosphate transferase